MDFKEVKIEIYVQQEYIVKIREELNKVNACRIGNYDNVIAITNVIGYWRPLEGANPYNGEIGELTESHECKLEIICKREYVRDAIKVIKGIHPYEEPLINIIPLVNELFE